MISLISKCSDFTALNDRLIYELEDVVVSFTAFSRHLPVQIDRYHKKLRYHRQSISAPRLKHRTSQI
jgi:hypothetical protein